MAVSVVDGASMDIFAIDDEALGSTLRCFANILPVRRSVYSPVVPGYRVRVGYD